jgi:hypothetical protein
MLKSIDILIGLSVVMLVVSMAVTLVNQGILAMLAKRGRCLQAGIADLLQLVDAGFSRPHAEEIAARVLTQPTIRRMTLWSWTSWIKMLSSWLTSNIGLRTWFPTFYQFGDVIHREEFTKILLSIGASQDETRKKLKELKSAIDENKSGTAREKVKTALSTLEDAIKKNTGVQYDKIENKLKEINEKQNPTDQERLFKELNELMNTLMDPILDKLNSTLKANGIDEPGKTMENVRMLALQLESSHPELASDVRKSKALLQGASSQFLAKINLGFDQIMDRVSTRFTNNTRGVTLLSAVLVAVVLQLDTVSLLNRFAMDDKMRDAFVAQAVKLNQDEEAKKMLLSAAKPEGKHEAPVKGNTPSAPTSAGGANNAAKISPPAVVNQPGSAANSTKEADLKTEKHYWNFLAMQGVINLPSSRDEWCKHWKDVNIPGLILSILLLSLGAPFWYNALSKLLQLRSILAQKDEDQKLIRQTTQTLETPSDSGNK